MSRCGAPTGHLVVFDRSADRSWDETGSFGARSPPATGRSPSGGCEDVQRQEGRHAHDGRVDEPADAEVERDAGDDAGLPAGEAVGSLTQVAAALMPEWSM